MSRVLVTGGGGFLGSRLVERLRGEGHEVSISRRAEYDLTSMEDTARLFSDTEPRARLPPRRGSRRDRRQPGEPRPLLVREPRDGRARARAGAAARHAEARDRRDDLRVPEVRPGAVPRGGPLERLPGGDERPVRRREEGDPRRRAVVPRAVRDERDLPASREPLWTGRQLRPRDLARDSRADPEDGRGRRARRPRDRALGGRQPDPRVPPRRRLRARPRARRRPVRRGGPGQPRHGRRDRDPRPRRADPGGDGLRRHDHLGHVSAERPAATPAGHDESGEAVRVHRRGAVARRDRRTVAWYRAQA